MSLRSEVLALVAESRKLAEVNALAIAALEEISDDTRTSLRRRDENCVRYVTSDALEEIERATNSRLSGVRWTRGTQVSGDVYAESERR